MQDQPAIPPMKVSRMTETKPPQPGDDLQMMQSPNNWPQYPVLPLKKKKSQQPLVWEAGLLVEVFPSKTDEYIFWLPGKSMFDSISLADAKAGKKMESESDFQALLDDGWVVD